tara:strand:+ start:97489 stop:97860 length:372 start_codon:yes stop_codon:yes gene_type:complete
MSIFQCQVCGCAENTACGWFHTRFNERLNKPEDLGIAKCSACGPQTYPSGDDNKNFNGEWHGRFKRRFLPHGEFFTNEQGNIEHVHSGLIGNEAYEVYGADVMYPKVQAIYPVPANPRFKKKG